MSLGATEKSQAAEPGLFVFMIERSFGLAERGLLTTEQFIENAKKEETSGYSPEKV